MDSPRQAKKAQDMTNVEVRKALYEVRAAWASHAQGHSVCYTSAPIKCGLSMEYMAQFYANEQRRKRCQRYERTRNDNKT